MTLEDPNCPFCGIASQSPPTINFPCLNHSLNPRPAPQAPLIHPALRHTINDNSETLDEKLPFNVFLSTPYVIGFLDIQPLTTSAAHILVVPRAHFPTLDSLWPFPAAGSSSSSSSSSLPNSTTQRPSSRFLALQSSQALGSTLPLISAALRDVLQVADFNVIQNNGVGAGQVVDHVHFHVVARPAIKYGQPESEDQDEFSFFNSSRDMTKYIAQRLLDETPQKPASKDARFRYSYAAQVFGRGQREDLDEDWGVEFVKKLRKKIRELVASLETECFETTKRQKSNL